jgi:hypothetical protein
MAEEVKRHSASSMRSKKEHDQKELAIYDANIFITIQPVIINKHYHISLPDTPVKLRHRSHLLRAEEFTLVLVSLWYYF